MLGPPTFRSCELQVAVIGVRVVFHDDPADLHEIIAITANAEVHGVGGAILRQMRTVAGITEVAVLPKFVV